MQTNKNDVLFGTSVFGGFNRQDVINYIDALQRSGMNADAAEQSETVSKLRTAEFRIESLAAENEVLKKEIETLREQLGRIPELEKEVQLLLKEIAEAEATGEPEESEPEEEFFSAVLEENEE